MFQCDWNDPDENNAMLVFVCACMFNKKFNVFSLSMDSLYFPSWYHANELVCVRAIRLSDN